MRQEQDELGHVSNAPTRPGPGATAGVALDLTDLYGSTAGTAEQGPPLDEKLRQAYFWITNHAIISPHYDVEFEDGPSRRFRFGDARAELVLPSGQSYSSYVLMPLLTFMVRGRCLMVGGPGRGKTASALLMGVLAGYTPREMRRAMQHGHPQLTVSDMFGTPLPRDLVEADRLADVDVAWRGWLGMRVKIVDEYNRIPTRTQSALLTVLADGYVESFDQVYETGRSAWYLTANDDAGGGTYQVIDALRDRIDVVVPALPFNNRFLSALVSRAERGLRPEEAVPESIVFTEREHDRLHRAVLDVPIPRPVLRRLEFFAGQLEFLERGGRQFEYRTKDTARLAGVDPHLVQQTDSGRDALIDVGTQTTAGLSVRSLQSLIAYSKAMAYFRGDAEVGLDHLRAVLPYVLLQKLPMDPDSPVFDQQRAEELRLDRVSWLRTMFDTTCRQYDAAGLDHDDPVGHELAQFDRGLDGTPEHEVRSRLHRIEDLLEQMSAQRKLYGHLYDDALALKYLHQRYTNYLAWLRWSG
ncbi:MoxR family ATPase [Luteipulveratus flavus]|uniref:AAA family ATPase n=1 Tax=Luteipulveratus flavus TaxID=3031728 RepID=A0ABT6C7J5_9MICO|nr:AAA family ATPase [Luteipulveratus sp. YIM 133296]MDF8264681.1 AAA family ATPase [Luteipulveratus sp. YIM 133296]